MRVEFANAWYHVMNSGRRDEVIFQSSDDKSLFIIKLKESARLYKVEIAAFCLLPDQYQLLVKTPKANLSSFMRHLSSVYTQIYNRKYGYSGAIFKGRYKSALVESGNHLLEVMKYLHNYPVDNGIVNHLADYQWTSHKEYLSKDCKKLWLNVSDILNLLSDDLRLQKNAYSLYLQKEKKEDVTRYFLGKRSSILGELETDIEHDLFAETSCSTASEGGTQMADNSVEKITEIICNKFQMPKSFLLYSQRGQENFARDATIYLSRLHCNDSLTEIGKHFGLNSPSSVSSAIKRVTTKMESEESISRLIDEIEKEIISY